MSAIHQTNLNGVVTMRGRTHTEHEESDVSTAEDRRIARQGVVWSAIGSLAMIAIAAGGGMYALGEKMNGPRVDPTVAAIIADIKAERESVREREIRQYNMANRFLQADYTNKDAMRKFADELAALKNP